jgi:RimJ/RimL family protein N-acetyltransferase
MMGETTSMITLRPMTLEDLSAIDDWFWNFDDVALFERGLPIPVNNATLQKTWKPALEQSDPPNALWYLAMTEDNIPVGIGGLQSINYIHGDAVLPVFIKQSMRAKGVGTALTITLLNLAFDRLRLHRLTTFYRSDNEATDRALQRLGFKTEGRIREGWFSDGAHRDVIQVGLLKTEWLGQREEIPGGDQLYSRVDLDSLSSIGL